MLKKVVLRCALLIFIAISPGFTAWASSGGQPATFADTSGHWAEETIDWGVKEGIVRGFPDGTFQPDGGVTQAQFLAMLFRAFPSLSPSESGDPWYSAYYERAAEWNWPVTVSRADQPLNRGETARITAASQGRLLSVEASVEFLLEAGLAQGRQTADGRTVFGALDPLTRAEAVQFIRNMTDAGVSIGPASEFVPKLDKESSGAQISVDGITIGDSEEKLLTLKGEPARKDVSEYGFSWYVYNEDYERFAMFGIEQGRIVGLYANGDSISLKGLNASSKAQEVRRMFGEPLEYILKGKTRYLINKMDEYDKFETDAAFVTVFYDLHEGGKMDAVQAIEKETELAFDGFYGKGTKELQLSFERQSLDLVNSARVQRGLSELRWDDPASGTARRHSEDMATHDYMSHYNAAGEGPGDRLRNDQVPYRAAGENVAYGYASAIFAHAGWMNSEGHRNNMLGSFDYFGAGVAFGEDDAPYYTQLFIRR